MLNLPLTIHGLYAKVPGITSFLPWRRPATNLKKAKSIRLLARHHSGVNQPRVRKLSRDPSIPLRGAIRLPPLIPRKRAVYSFRNPVQRKPSVVRQRAAALRGKRVEALRAQNVRKNPPGTPPSTKPIRREKVRTGAELRFNPEPAQKRLDAACDRAERRAGPRPRTLEDTAFIEQMAKMNFRHRFATERFVNRVRLDQAQDMVEERLRQQADHDKRAREIRARREQGKQRQQFVFSQHSAQPSSTPAPPQPPPAKPKFFSKSPKPMEQVDESLRQNWARQEEIFKADAERRAHQARIAAGEIPPNTRLRYEGEWSLWEKVRVGLEKVYEQVNEEQKIRERKARAERQRKEEEAARAAWAREAEARAEEERVRKRTREQEEQAQIRAAWEEKTRRETELKEALKAAEEEKARLQAQRAAEIPIRPASIPFIPPQTNDPELYEWEMYERRWAAIRREGVEVVPFPLRFDQLPWPMFHFKPMPINLGDFREEEIHHFVLSTKRPGYQGKHAKERLRGELLHYHPDKFNARVLPYVLEAEREKVMDGASRITIMLHNLLRALPAGCS